MMPLFRLSENKMYLCYLFITTVLVQYLAIFRQNQYQSHANLVYHWIYIASGPKPGLHNSESSKGQIININLPQAAKDYLISM